MIQGNEQLNGTIGHQSNAAQWNNREHGFVVIMGH